VRVLLISPNEETLPDPVFPLGLACLAGALEERGHRYQVLDLCVDVRPEAVSSAIAGFRPEVLALSLRNIDNVAYPGTTSYVSAYRALCREIRGLSSAPLVLGGAGFSLFPERLIAHLGADFGIVGAGEGPLAALLDAVEGRGRILDVPGLVIREGGRVTVHPRPSLPGQASLPQRRGFPLAAYFSMGGMANIQTKRGCPFGCVYCAYPLIEGSVTRSRPVASVITEIETLAADGFDEVFFVDSVFNHPLDYAKEVCRGIISAGLSIKWTCYAAPWGLDEEAVQLFKESGCIGIEFGTDSLSAPVLKALGKAFSGEDVERASALCRAADIPFCHAILAGGPGEDRSTLAETVARLERIGPTAVVFMTGIRIIPGTRLAETAAREGLISRGAPLLDPVFYLSDAVRPFLETEVRRLARIHKNWVFPGYAIRCSRSLAEKLRRRGVRGPLWLNMSARPQ
jgi:radical SAM superfamily enzyme YgiQ (UPF0313 family)